jgi:phosphate starvation-inducible PhoH-like protein
VDVVRHPLVQEVVRAYDAFDAERKARIAEEKGARAAARDPGAASEGDPT